MVVKVTILQKKNTKKLQHAFGRDTSSTKRRKKKDLEDDKKKKAAYEKEEKKFKAQLMESTKFRNMVKNIGLTAAATAATVAAAYVYVTRHPPQKTETKAQTETNRTRSSQTSRTSRTRPQETEVQTESDLTRSNRTSQTSLTRPQETDPQTDESTDDQNKFIAAADVLTSLDTALDETGTKSEESGFSNAIRRFTTWANEYVVHVGADEYV